MKNLQLFYICLCSSILFCSCVKDTDFSQAEDVTLTPVVEVNLIHFDLEGNDFFDSGTSTPRLVVSDTTEIRFLDDTSVQESLLRADFLFEFTNSIPREFQTNFQFLSTENEETYSTATSVLAGTPENPVFTEFTHTVQGENIARLTQADRVVVSVTIPSADATLEGNLNMQSKTTYYLEIKERN